MRVGRSATRARGGSVAGRRVGSMARAAALFLGVSLGWSVSPGHAAAAFDRPPSGGRSGMGLALVSALDAREEALSAASAADVGKPSHDPGRMFLLSLAVPGAGQLVQGEKRGYLYLLAELSLWGGFYALDQAGLKERGEYEAFADSRWNYDKYMEWYCAECSDTSSSYDCRPLAEYGTQEYYEDIGKYAPYWRWWHLDGDEGDTGASAPLGPADEALLNEYRGMRGQSNDDLRNARYFMMAALLNHVVAAFDSFVSARRGSEGDGRDTADLGVEFGVPAAGDGLSCALVARY